jgi:hypothetical protein
LERVTGTKVSSCDVPTEYERIEGSEGTTRPKEKGLATRKVDGP